MTRAGCRAAAGHRGADPRAGVRTAVVEYTRAALYDAVHYVFRALVVVAARGLVAHLLLPRRATMLEFED